MKTLLILGASVRAAAQSAVRAGVAPVCADLFCDADLRAMLPCRVARRYPHDLERIAQECRPGPWMYTGGLENQPALVARIASGRTLYGNPAEVLRRVRDPFHWAHALARWDIACPTCRTTADPPPRDSRWLLKHRRSSGGQQMRVWCENTPPPPCGPRSAWYFQRLVTGVPCGAVFVAAGGTARLVDVTEQLLTGAGEWPLRYAGSLGPLPLTAEQTAKITHLGQALAAEFQLRGLFGVDLVIEGEAVWPVEINPRYTASIEVLERATGVYAIALHMAAWEQGIVVDQPPPPATTWCGKFVVYAPSESRVSAKQTAGLLRESEGTSWPPIADIPVAGTQLRAGQPVVTVFAEAESREGLLAQLAERRLFVERNLFRSNCG